MKDNPTIFVFGSNLAGRHGAGAALYAMRHHGAVYGQGEGLQGASYAIPTKDRDIKPRLLEEIRTSVEKFRRFAWNNIHRTFRVTAIGCGLAGFTPQQIGPMFEFMPLNCTLPPEFASYRSEQDGLPVGTTSEALTRKLVGAKSR